MQLIRKIAVKPYVLKYIGHDHCIDPFPINKTNKYGLFLWNCLTKPNLKAVMPEPKERMKALHAFRGIILLDDLEHFTDQDIFDGLATSSIYNYIAAVKIDNPAIAQVLLSEFRKLKIQKADPIDYNIYSAQLDIMISENYWVKQGPIIPAARQLDFNKMVLYDFHDEFYKYVRMRIGQKGSINRAILNFRDQFDICEDELSFKTIQRAFQRHNEQVTRSLSA